MGRRGVAPGRAPPDVREWRAGVPAVRLWAKHGDETRMKCAERQGTEHRRVPADLCRWQRSACLLALAALPVACGVPSETQNPGVVSEAQNSGVGAFERHPWKMPVGFGAYDLGKDARGLPVFHRQFPEAPGQTFAQPTPLITVHFPPDGLVYWKNWVFEPGHAVAVLREALWESRGVDLGAALAGGLVASAEAGVSWRIVQDVVSQLVCEVSRDRPDGLVCHLVTGLKAENEWRSLAGGLRARTASSGERVEGARVHLAVVEAGVHITAGEGGEAILVPVLRQPVVGAREMLRLNKAWLRVARQLRGLPARVDEHVRIDAEVGVPVAFVIQVAYYLLRAGHAELGIGQLRLSKTP